MSHIISFKIEGLAGRKESVEIVLKRHTNILFGLNGSGKTSLLKILHAAMDNDTEILDSVPFVSAEVQIYSQAWDKVFTRTIKKTRSRQAIQPSRGRTKAGSIVISKEVMWADVLASEVEMEWSTKPATPKDAKHTRWLHQYLPTSRLHISDKNFHGSTKDYFASKRPWLTEEELDSVFASSVKHLWSQYSAHVLGAVRTAQEQGLASILQAVLSPQRQSTINKRRTSKLTSSTAYDRVHSFMERQNSSAILGSRKSFEARYSENPTLQDVVQDIDLIEDRITEAMASRDKLQSLITKMFRENKEISFTDESINIKTSSGEKIGLESLSSGEKHLLRIFVESLLVGDSSFMVDEPEISMHIDWQKDLIGSLNALNPEAQLIFATHSPEIMADVPDDNIFRI